MQRRDKLTTPKNENGEEAPNLETSQRSLFVRKSCRMILGTALFSALYFALNATEKYSVLSRGHPKVSQGASAVVKVSGEGTKSKRSFILQPESEFSPKISWLMSFPNSGTSFTMTMVARMSNRSIATNYADEVTAKDDPESLSIYSRRPEGPFWPGLTGKVSTPRPLPANFVLTKTHCGSRCVKCGPKEYIETPQVFLQRCASGHARVGPNRRRVDVEYPPERVKSAIHLIRNPFHNIIARYHLEYRHGIRSNKTFFVEHPNSPEGFQAWCKSQDTKYRSQDKEVFYDSKNLEGTICHAEFFKYTQWHNLVHESMGLLNHTIPVMLVYYEDYSADFNGTVSKILDFLDLESVGKITDFHPRTDYDSYFTKEQRSNVRNLVREFANDETWEEVKHYFKN